MNQSPKKVAMREQEPACRSRNFSEVALGYTYAEAKDEAERCLQCKNPLCVGGCPVGVPIPDFITNIKKDDLVGAYHILSAANALPAVTGRVCPQENQCEKTCIRGIKGEPVAIGRLERFVADWARENNVANLDKAEQTGKKVAVIGSGPAGLTCAGELARLGHAVTVFEAFHVPGGVLTYGIPEFRLPKDIVASEVENLKKMGVQVETNMVIGKILTIDELMERRGFDAVFVGSGAGLPTFMKIPGEGLVGVYSANEYLTRINLMKAYKPDSATPILKSRRVVVFGGGNVAMDAARCARRLGAEVSIVYRRSEAEMPARAEEVHHAKEEGIEFRFLSSPLLIEGDEAGRAASVTCIQMELGEPDESGRRSPLPIENSEFTLEADTVIVAIGTSPNPLIRSTTPGLAVNNRGCIVTSETGETSRSGLWAGGDASSGAATVILAMGAGKAAAGSIDRYLSGK